MMAKLVARSVVASSSAIALLAGASPALAQTEDQQAALATSGSCAGLVGNERADCLAAAGSDADATANQEAIIVTGSRIPRANFDTPQPAVVLGGQQIEQRGYTNVADALEELPAFGVPGSSPVGTGQSGEIGSGQNFVNFFGLGDQRTLTVVNGRRFVSSNTASIFGPSGTNGSQVDFNVLPTLLVDRVETIAIGGAPIYGSDAIAGTINVITKRDFQGLRIDAQAGVSKFGDATDYRIRGAAGTNFASGRGNIAISAEYNQTSGLDYASRPANYRLNSFFTTPGDPSSPFEQVLLKDRRIPSVSEFGIPAVSDAFLVLSPTNAETVGGQFGLPFPLQVGVTDNPSDPLHGNPLVFNSQGALIPIDFGKEAGDLVSSDGGNGFILPGNLLSPVKRYLAVALGQYQATHSVRLFGEGWYARSTGTQFRAQPEYNGYLFGAAGEPAGNLIISIDNPFLDPAARDLIAANLANNPLTDDPDHFLIGRANTDLISGRASSTVELYRFVAGVDGKFRALGQDMTFEIVGNYGKSKTRGHGRAIVQQNLENALNSVRDASGNIVCAPGSVNADIPTISATCAPLNPFGRNISQAARDYVTAITNPKSDSDQKVLTVSMSGDLFDIWGGGVGFAIGYEHREENTAFDPGAFFAGAPDPDPTVDDNGDGLPNNDRIPFGSSAIIDPVSGGFNTDEFFAELTIPLIGKDQDIPLIRSLELNGAFRYIDHSLAGADPTYTVGATWQPLSDITFRGNYTRSVRSPAITEYFNPTSQVFTTANDPCDARFVDSGPNPAVRRANCAAEGIDVDNFTSRIVDRTGTGTFSGNPNLVNEKADSYSFGVVLRPRFLPGFNLAVDWVNIKVKDAVEGLSVQNVLNACYDSSDYPNVTSASGTNFCDLFTRTVSNNPVTNGQITTFRTGFENAARRNFRGLIAELDWRVPTPFLGATSSLRLGTNFLYNDKLDLTIGVGDHTTLASSIGYSRYQATSNLTYVNGGFAWQWQAQYLGKAKNDPDAAENTFEFPVVKAVTFINSSMVYEMKNGVRLNFVVDNVFNTKQPFPAPAGGGSVTYFDGIRGRYFRFGAGINF